MARSYWSSCHTSAPGVLRIEFMRLVVLIRAYHPSIPDYRVPPTLRVKSLIAPTDAGVPLEVDEATNE